MSPRWGSTPRLTDWLTGRLTVGRNVTLTLTYAELLRSGDDTTFCVRSWLPEPKWIDIICVGVFFEIRLVLPAAFVMPVHASTKNLKSLTVQIDVPLSQILGAGIYQPLWWTCHELETEKSGFNSWQGQEIFLLSKDQSDLSYIMHNDPWIWNIFYSILPWGPPSLMSNRYRGALSLRIKRLGRKVHHPLSLSSEVKNM
jgi:hypothetical protein